MIYKRDISPIYLLKITEKNRSLNAEKIYSLMKDILKKINELLSDASFKSQMDEEKIATYKIGIKNVETYIQNIEDDFFKWLGSKEIKEKSKEMWKLIMASAIYRRMIKVLGSDFDLFMSAIEKYAQKTSPELYSFVQELKEDRAEK